LDKVTKILIVVCFVLIGSLGFLSGVFLKSKPGGDHYDVTIEGDDQGVTEDSKGPSWHRVMSFAGTGSDYRYVNIEGNKFKVVVSAAPIINYDVNTLTVDVLRDGYALALETLEWGPTESPARKRKIIEVSGGPGYYSISVYAYEIEAGRLPSGTITDIFSLLFNIGLPLIEIKWVPY